MKDLHQQAARWGQWAQYYDEETRNQDPSAAAAVLSDLAGDGAALELGIGTGRVAFPLAEWGTPVFGLDASQKMINRLEEYQKQTPEGRSPVQARIGDMARFDLGTHYPLVYVIASTLFLLTEQEDQVSCFRSAARHLTPQGQFVVEPAVPHTSGMSSERQQMIVREMIEEHLSWSAFVHDPVHQIVRAQEVRVGPDGCRLLPKVMRYAHPAELGLMAQLAGLRLERRTADWKGSPFTATSTHHVSVYSRQPAAAETSQASGHGPSLRSKTSS
ncbi:class I SAM-dependent methyltransferase [Streptomyces sp. H27-C3]|uniref:class I SAM-dependent methyltransferase n=1 Tax=Streptomyces sp. H27-C3 TaxID=3046305 RepID=UPI0024B9EC4A|nr:class I SAM-dependent methyltransferase [Streptomyces sp. H27-C3]MDJ0466072.1 class I SAM-dependent methyltransferase [Streptomyces sp. H27-C3]